MPIRQKIEDFLIKEGLTDHFILAGDPVGGVGTFITSEVNVGELSRWFSYLLAQEDMQKDPEKPIPALAIALMLALYASLGPERFWFLTEIPEKVVDPEAMAEIEANRTMTRSMN